MADQSNSKTVAIIGFGTAGMNAAIALRNAGFGGRVLVFSDIDTLPYSPILTSYYAWGDKTYEECFPWSAEEVADLNLDILYDEPVEALDTVTHAITTSKGTYGYDKCVIATGATPMCWGFPEVEGDSAYRPLVLRSMADAQRLKDALERPGIKRILVSGASMVALKTLEACLNHGLECTLVGINPHVLDFNALPEAAIRFEKGLREKGVELRLGQSIKAVKRIGDKLEVTFSSGDTDVFDEISVAHGMKSNLDFVVEGALETDRALIVDEFMRTSDPDVYAAGDVAQATELISGEKRIVGIWKNAALQGATAGAAIAAELAGGQPDEECAFKGSISTNTIAVNGTLFISAGTMEITPERSIEVREAEDMTVVYIFENREGKPRRLVGFNLVCDKDEPGSVAYDTGAMLTLRIEAGCR
ncbi:MAG: FAD-dependent oxidoreductase [Eggerthellaceae bacterium]|nr:FAD-dependent oxidoreductase [Eggerthellaceae bacterium]